MLSVIRNAAVASARSSTARVTALPLRRAYATENNTEQPKEEKPVEEKKDDNDPSKLLAEKEKKIAELQVCSLL